MFTRGGMRGRWIPETLVSFIFVTIDGPTPFLFMPFISFPAWARVGNEPG